MSTVESRSIEENSLIIRCINDLGLIQLDRDDSLSSEAMVRCCNRLLAAAPMVLFLYKIFYCSTMRHIGMWELYESHF